MDRLIARRQVHLREKALWRMLFETAARVEEILAVNIEDLDLGSTSTPPRAGRERAETCTSTVIPPAPLHPCTPAPLHPCTPAHLGASPLMPMAKSMHKKPENLRRYFKPSSEAISELTSLLAPGDSRR
ncbi:hypothetical protein SAMN05216499_109191 [Actinacidiphila paucisporea]|uniref:Tyr recombinase domain-containing protein n=1 Tax=Actinacidiphila paucisporea TaxID=310782 RepID=A0A1M7H8I6_9ACTN|nr:hypothetical protein SAMN05216499_109191 [Actinacidiphila paucisporea]